MTTKICPDCDSPGDGNCPVCHGKGNTQGDEISGRLEALGCSACRGSGTCQTCGGMGEVEIGGEG